MNARDLMTPHPHVVAADESISRAARLMRDFELGCLPVVDDRSTMKLSGIITDRDLVTRCLAGSPSGEARIGDHMTAAPLATIPPDAALAEVGGMMTRHGLRRLLVTDRGKLVGIISSTDLARKIGWLPLPNGSHPRTDPPRGSPPTPPVPDRDRDRSPGVRARPSTGAGDGERLTPDAITFREFLQAPACSALPTPPAAYPE
jgi:CBS domain-containing protein